MKWEIVFVVFDVLFNKQMELTDFSAYSESNFELWYYTKLMYIVRKMPKFDEFHLYCFIFLIII